MYVYEFSGAGRRVSIASIRFSKVFMTRTRLKITGLMLSKYPLEAVTKDTNYQLLTDRKEEFQKDSSNLPIESLMPPKWVLAEANWSRRQHKAHYTQ